MPMRNGWKIKMDEKIALFMYGGIDEYADYCIRTN